MMTLQRSSTEIEGRWIDVSYHNTYDEVLKALTQYQDAVSSLGYGLRIVETVTRYESATRNFVEGIKHND